IANFTGVAEAGDQGSSFALCATAGGPAHVVVKAASTIGANATQQVSPPILTTATCPGSDQLVGGGAMTTTPDTVNNGTTAGNNGNVKPMASYPSDATGAMLADGSTTASSWTAFGSAGITAATDQVIAFAVCSTDASAPPVQVARADTIGPLGQPGTTVLNAPVTCPTGTRLLGGGYRVDETVAGTAGLQPQQGEHMRGSYPAAANGAYPDGSLVEALDGTPNPTTWTSVGQLGGQNLPANAQLVQHGFALCAQSVTAPAVTTGAASGVTGTSAGVAGTVTPNGLGTTFVFEFGPSQAFGTITPPTSAGSGQSAVGVTGSFSGLQPGTTYLYRVVATNAQGTTFGPTMSFTTAGAQAPDAVT
ncbi:MAG TPA: fibronectin type III domain-containing protein, partial [Solirubrobacteraceae bacterium]|nr:fibronectin type III domain-containing protein [Solirubrobacteraceae bacterium]